MESPIPIQWETVTNGIVFYPNNYHPLFRRLENGTHEEIVQKSAIQFDYASEFYSDDQYIYLIGYDYTNKTNQVTVLDIQNPQQIQNVASFTIDTLSSLRSRLIQGIPAQYISHYLIDIRKIGDQVEIHVFDVLAADPTVPIFTMPFPGGFWATYNDKLYISATQKLVVVDFSKAPSIQTKEYSNLDFEPWEIAVSDDLIILTSWKYARIFSFDPQNDRLELVGDKDNIEPGGCGGCTTSYITGDFFVDEDTFLGLVVYKIHKEYRITSVTEWELY